MIRRTFCLVRHGQTDANRDGIIAGTTEAQLTSHGQSAARSLSALDWPPVALFSSPQARARETAALAFPGLAVTIVAGLCERDWGIFEGRPISELPPRESTPPWGEDWPGFVERVRSALDTCLGCDDGRLPVIVAHSGVVRAARALTGGDYRGASAPNTTPLLFTPMADGWRESRPYEGAIR